MVDKQLVWTYIEDIKAKAKKLGWEVTIEYFPNSKNIDYVAIHTIKDDGSGICNVTYDGNNNLPNVVKFLDYCIEKYLSAVVEPHKKRKLMSKNDKHRNQEELF